MALEVGLNAVVVQQRVVHVDQEDEGSRRHDAATIEASGRDISTSADRAEACVTSRSDSQADVDSMASVERQRQLPCAVPGWFIRASFPSLSPSCSGAIDSAETADHCIIINVGGASM